MKTTQEVIKNSNIPASLIRAVVRQIGDKESLQDVANHGADAGYAGFTYTADTVKFFKAHRQDICALVESMASDLGENPLDMVAGFQCLAGRNLKRSHIGGEDWAVKEANRAKLAEFYPSVSRCLYGGRLTDDDSGVANALAWFALEEVARAFCDE